MGSFTPELKRMVWERDGGHCVRCGVAVFQPEIHHRRPRMMGGGNAREEWINDHANLLTLDSDCHRWIERNRDEAKVHGWLLDMGVGQVPADVLVAYHDGVLYRLHDDFFRTPVDLWREGMDVRALAA